MKKGNRLACQTGGEMWIECFIKHQEVYKFNCHQVLSVLDLSQKGDPQVILQISRALFLV